MEIAIVGTGRVAERNYLPALLRHQDVSVTCYSRSPARAEAVGRQFGVRVAATPAALFEREPAAVLVLTREEQRLVAARALLPFRPKRLFFEKPLVARNGQTDVVEADFWDGKELLQAAQAAGTETAMVFNYRFFDQTQRAISLIRDRRFGAAVNIVAFSHFACWSHCIDLITLLAGPVREISAQAGTRTHAFNTATPVDVAASFMTDNQASGTILGTAGLNWEFPLFELTINFEGGRIHMRGLDQTMEVVDYHGNVHEHFAPSRQTSRWDKYNRSFEKSVGRCLP
jgi:predicted dehydrogenase